MGEHTQVIAARAVTISRWVNGCSSVKLDIINITKNPIKLKIIR